MGARKAGGWLATGVMTTAMATGVACSGSNEPAPPPPPPPKTCNLVWDVTQGDAAASAVIANGVLTLTAPEADAFSAIAVSQTLSGDFDVSFAFDPANLAAGGFAQATIGADGTAIAVAGLGKQIILGETVFTGLGAAVGSALDPFFAASAQTAGTLRLQRVGATITATATTGDAEATLASPDMTTEPVEVGVQLGRHPSIAEPLSGISTLTLQGFTVATGAYDDDPFNCDSLIAP